jgi:CRP-like cAMP-binding protein
MSLPLDHFLHHVPVLAGLNDAAIACLAGLGREETFPPDTVIIGEGELGNRVYFLRAGHATVVKGYGGPWPVELARFGPGECFGEMSMVESAARSATVVAEDQVTVFTLKGADLHRLYKELPAQYGILMLNVARQLARRVRALDEQLWHASR